MPGWPPPLVLLALLSSCHTSASMVVQRGYTILIVPLGTALGSLEALRVFFWVSDRGARLFGITTSLPPPSSAHTASKLLALAGGWDLIYAENDSRPVSLRKGKLLTVEICEKAPDWFYSSFCGAPSPENLASAASVA
uniref:Uncharacterized protein n=1 Tax=Sphaerodactylus townsendi TaxID=933632 RepID=A0ACB8EH30_9SAUR